jgi:hypothetical protein
MLPSRRSPTGSAPVRPRPAAPPDGRGCLVASGATGGPAEGDEPCAPTASRWSRKPRPVNASTPVTDTTADAATALSRIPTNSRAHARTDARTRPRTNSRTGLPPVPVRTSVPVPVPVRAVLILSSLLTSVPARVPGPRACGAASHSGRVHVVESLGSHPIPASPRRHRLVPGTHVPLPDPSRRREDRWTDEGREHPATPLGLPDPGPPSAPPWTITCACIYCSRV